MAKRVFNEPFLMIPYALLRIPEYGRYFDGAPIGFIHRLLMTGVRRQYTDGLRYYKEGGWVTELAKRYDNGELSAYFTLEGIEEATGFTQRHIRDFIKKLEELKLVQVEEFGSGYIFVVGRRLKLEANNGYSVGEDHEGFFIDSWETWAQRDKYSFRVFIIENLVPPKAREKLLGKILPKLGKNFSETDAEVSVREERPEQENSGVDTAPRIDRVSIDLLQEDSTESANPLNALYARIRSEPNWIDAEKVAREAIQAGATLAKVNSLLSDRVPDKYDRFRRFPRFAFRLYAFDHSESEASKADYVKLSMLWKALNEDVTGVNYGENAKFYTEVRGAYKKHLTSKYSYEQCLWTLKKAVGTERTLNFLAQGGRNLITLVQQNSKEYHELRQEAMREEKPRKEVKVVEMDKDAAPVEGFDLLDSLFERNTNG